MGTPPPNYRNLYRINMVNVTLFVHQASYNYFPIPDLSKIGVGNSFSSYWMWYVHLDLDWMSPSVLQEQNLYYVISSAVSLCTNGINISVSSALVSD